MKATKDTLRAVTTGVKSKARSGAITVKKNILTLKDRAAANMEAFLKARRNK